MGLEIRGLDGLTEELEAMAQRVTATGANRALKEGAKPIFEDMQRRTLIDPKPRSEEKNLHSSIKVSRIKNRKRSDGSRKPTDKQITIGTHRAERKAPLDKKERKGKAPHAHLVEYGHGGPAPAPPHPFIRPAFDTKADEAYRIIRDVLQEELRG